MKCSRIFAMAMLVLFLAMSGLALAAEVEIGDPIIDTENSSLLFPIDLNVVSEENVAGCNMVLAYSQNIALTNVTEGAAATAADKGVTYSSTETGTIRLIIYGMNQNTINSGTIAHLIFAIPEGGDQDVEITFSAVVAASPEAQSVPVTHMEGFSGTIAGMVPPVDDSTAETDEEPSEESEEEPDTSSDQTGGEEGTASENTESTSSDDDDDNGLGCFLSTISETF